MKAALAALSGTIIFEETGPSHLGRHAPDAGQFLTRIGDVVLALENAIYSVISPEGCASILWRTSDMAKQAAVAMRLTASEQQALGVIDTVIAEPGDGAHEDHQETARRLGEAIEAMEQDEVIAEALGDHVYTHYLEAKREEWSEYKTQVTEWERDRYLEAY